MLCPIVPFSPWVRGFWKNTRWVRVWLHSLLPFGQSINWPFGGGGVGVAGLVHELIRQGGKRGHGFFFKLNIGAIWEVLIGSNIVYCRNFPQWWPQINLLPSQRVFFLEIFNNFGRKIGVFERFGGGFFLWLIWGSSPRALWIPIYLGAYLG